MPPPDGFKNFAGLVEFVGASANTVRSVVEHLRIKPHCPGGNVTLYSDADAVRVREHYTQHGGYYRSNGKSKRRAVRKGHSSTAGRD